MKENKSFFKRNLSAIILVLIFILYEIFHLFMEGFQSESQIYLITTILPFVLIGGILDFFLSRNHTLKPGYKIVAKLIPAGIFVMFFLSTISYFQGKGSIKIFFYIIYMCLTFPFFIASYKKESHKWKLIFSLIGTALVAFTYLYLTTKTEALNEDKGAFIYFISYFFMLYAASGIKKLPFVGTILGALNAIILYLFMFNPITADAYRYGWDFDITVKFESMLFITFIVCILFQFISAIQMGKEQNT